MRKLYITAALIFLGLALILAFYGYYLNIRAPGIELSLMEFVEKAIMKVVRYIIK